MKRPLALSFALLAGTSAMSAEPPGAPITVGAVTVHLLLSPSGQFSEDVTALPGFESWNFRSAVSVGPVDEDFNSFIVKVRLRAARSVYQKGKVASVTVRSLERKKLLFTSDISNVHVPVEGERVVAKLVEGHVCEPIEILVVAGKSTMKKNLNFRCGE